MTSFRICPSILNADQDRLPQEIARIALDAELLHLDIMDNIFVPNKTFDFAQSKAIIEESPIPVDVHLMITDPDHLAASYAQAGAASVTFHFEATTDPAGVIASIRGGGARVGMAIKPKTDLEIVAQFIADIDMLLIMTVEPGFGGQSFMSDMMPKVKKARTIIDLLPNPRPWLQVDGGISLTTIEAAATAGADTFVVGSALFKAEDPAIAIREMKNVLNHGRLA
ncbi:MAG: ribulose-phosphate 3-epimerase [Actinomycetes bacterium]